MLKIHGKIFSLVVFVAFAGSVFAQDGESGGIPTGTYRVPNEQLPASGKDSTGLTSSGLATAPISEEDLYRFRYCGSDSDCIAVVNGCCDCANGGQEVAIAKSSLGEFKALFDCNQVSCGQRYPTPECRQGYVSCLKNRCTFTQDREYRQKNYLQR